MRERKEIEAKVLELESDLLSAIGDRDEVDAMIIEGMLVSLRWVLGSEWPIPVQ